jgi:L-iditol 2-dehydrogenase
VVAVNSAPCYQCYLCLKGNHNLCENLEFLNGAYADYIRIPKQIVQYNTYRLPEHLSFEAAAFTEPLAVTLRGVELSGVSPGDRVAIIGLGAIGQLLTRVAKWKGAHVTAMARSPYKLEVSKRFGQADETVLLPDDWDPLALRHQHSPQGYGFDVVIEAVGLPETWEKAIQLARRGGKVNLFAGCESGTTISLDTRRVHYDEITLLSLFHHTPFYVKKALDLLSTYAIDPTPLISEHLPMSRFAEALEKVGSGQAIKIALCP